MSGSTCFTFSLRSCISSNHFLHAKRPRLLGHTRRLRRSHVPPKKGRAANCVGRVRRFPSILSAALRSLSKMTCRSSAAIWISTMLKPCFHSMAGSFADNSNCTSGSVVTTKQNFRASLRQESKMQLLSRFSVATITICQTLVSELVECQLGV